MHIALFCGEQHCIVLTSHSSHSDLYFAESSRMCFDLLLIAACVVYYTDIILHCVTITFNLFLVW